MVDAGISEEHEKIELYMHFPITTTITLVLMCNLYSLDEGLEVNLSTIIVGTWIFEALRPPMASFPPNLLQSTGLSRSCTGASLKAMGRNPCCRMIQRPRLTDMS